jgi:pyruvate dehydrogenase E1 component
MPSQPAQVSTLDAVVTAERQAMLRALERKALWLAVWMVHHANHLRPKADGLKVGGHQASSASIVTLMTALYFEVLQPDDRIAVKPHASPVFHAIQYLLGRQTRENLERFRALGGAQAYPSRTKDADDVDFSTGSVGLGVAMTSFASLLRDYLHTKRLIGDQAASGRMIALLGDAEFDEGNVFEAMLEGWKHQIRRVWWIIDYNRQSLDAIVTDRLFQRMDSIFHAMEWEVVTLKYGRLLERAFARRGGDALRTWIDRCPNVDYSALAHAGGGAWRARLRRDLSGTSGIAELLDEHDDRSLHELMTNLGGHDLDAILQAFAGAPAEAPTCFIAYTIKGNRLPFAGHKDNHAGLMSPEQVALFKRQMRIADGEEWDPAAGLEFSGEELAAFLRSVPFARPAERRHDAPLVAVPASFTAPHAPRMSTQEGFGRLLSNIAREHPVLADRVVTTSPDVTISTNLGSWVNRRGVFARIPRADVEVEYGAPSPQKWSVSPAGQHIELGIAESNMFTLLGALGLAGPLFGTRLLPIGTVYDPFIARGLDALNYACYQDARFILVATPSGISLAPEGGAHQSVITPLIGIGQPSLTSFEPAYVDELTAILRWSFEHLQADDGGSVYLRLSTRPLEQPPRELDAALADAVIRGGYWLIAPSADADIHLVACGAVVPEALDACRQIAEDIPGAGLLVVTSPARLHRDWLRHSAASVRRGGNAGASPSHVAALLGGLNPEAGLVTVIDGHPAALSWLGAVCQHRVAALGVEKFGQSGSVPDLYRTYGLDAEAIVGAAARLCVEGITSGQPR